MPRPLTWKDVYEAELRLRDRRVIDAFELTERLERIAWAAICGLEPQMLPPPQREGPRGLFQINTRHRPVAFDPTRQWLHGWRPWRTTPYTRPSK